MKNLLIYDIESSHRNIQTFTHGSVTVGQPYAEVTS